MATVRRTFLSMAYFLVIGLVLDHVAVVAQAPTPAPGLWLLVHASARCDEKAAEAKDLGDSNILGCQARTLADAECDNQMFGDGVSCKCVRMGRVCDLVASTAVTDGVYEYKLVGNTHAAVPELASPRGDGVNGVPMWTAPRAEEIMLFPHKPKAVDCLDFHRDGCFSIQDAQTCVNHRDGQSTPSWNGVKIHGEPCVWCGPSCVWACEPFEFLMRGEGMAFVAMRALQNLTVANCEQGASRPVTLKELVKNTKDEKGLVPGSSALAPWWIQRRPTEEQVRCLDYNRVGCGRIRDMGTCLRSRDGRSLMTVHGLKIHGEPCVWCGGGACHSDSKNRCEPYDYLMWGEGRAFSSFYAKGFYRVASCDAPVKLPLPKLDCLAPYARGCSAITNKHTCLQSVDGRQVESEHGLKIRGQPCVWCGGGVCHTNKFTLCEPLDYLVNGEGRVFMTFIAKLTSSVAACKGNDPHHAMLAGWFAPTWPHVASPKLVPGSECINFPACVEIGLRFGSCCPDFAGTTLPCCARSQGVRGIALPTMPLVLPQLPTEAPQIAESVKNVLGSALGSEKNVSVPELHGHLPVQLPEVQLPASVRLPTFPAQLPTFPAKQPSQQPQHQQPQVDLNGLALPMGPALPSHQSSSNSHNDRAVNPSDITTTRVRAVTLPMPLAPVLRHKGQDCYIACNKRPGFCDWCGSGNACCMFDDANSPVECSGINYFLTARYECVIPVGATDSSSRRPAFAAPSVTRKPAVASTHQRSLPLGVQPVGSTTFKVEKIGSTTLKVEKKVKEGKEKEDRGDGGGSFASWMFALLFLCCCMFCVCAAWSWYMGMSDKRKKKIRDMISQRLSTGGKKKRKVQETDVDSSSSEALLLDCNMGLDRQRQNQHISAASDRELTGGLAVPAGAIVEPMQQQHQQQQQQQLLPQNRISRPGSLHQQQQFQQLQQHPISQPGSPQEQQRRQQEQLQYDLVTITPDGPKVISLAGQAPPPGIPIADKPLDLITMPQGGGQSGPGSTPPVVPTPPLQHSYTPNPAGFQAAGSLRAPLSAPSATGSYEMVNVPPPRMLQVQPTEGNVPPGMPVMNVQQTPALAQALQRPEGPLVLV